MAGNERERDFETAKAYALRLLKYRSRAEKELIAKLKEKGYSFVLITEVINWLKEYGFVNDESFAWLYAYDSLTIHFKGPHRIRRELINFGVDKDIVEKTLRKLEMEIDINSILKRYVERARTDFKDAKSLEKLKAKLYRRGFTNSMIVTVLKEVSISQDM
ncbi:hypothetical protein AT15_06975 [Kosmotoga arenicorallina S304]|uniref:Regulatory protein RecX n=1 Tax=Kosmotoga arenicorallina S304 TaxID=1453497 RepID=A0A176K2M9_9BACT|nr:RecX family transcriptional regulator [Kosmotoga arenicorallina]OAA31233.1 hypothetical protein AT15_06975 [Kosmotoga arenicorallina S304]